MNLLSWNCRGLGNPQTVRNLRLLVEDKRPTVLFLMETKLQRIKMSLLRVKLKLIVCSWLILLVGVGAWLFSGRRMFS
ncbi:hypothetical protein SLA2020_348110 [Shorea laevis]